jgi:hypothetical protein
MEELTAAIMLEEPEDDALLSEGVTDIFKKRKGEGGY